MGAALPHLQAGRCSLQVPDGSLCLLPGSIHLVLGCMPDLCSTHACRKHMTQELRPVCYSCEGPELHVLHVCPSVELMCPMQLLCPPKSKKALSRHFVAYMQPHSASTALSQNTAVHAGSSSLSCVSQNVQPAPASWQGCWHPLSQVRAYSGVLKGWTWSTSWV